VDRLPALSGRQVLRILEKAGFHSVARRGSHVKMRRGDTVVTVPVHANRPLKRPTLMGILKDAGLTIDQVLTLLR
jgi:predicted RNA binding protein YcfA (HicA-like mRNA interferase family)